jgi:hypothetical protein
VLDRFIEQLGFRENKSQTRVQQAQRHSDDKTTNPASIASMAMNMKSEELGNKVTGQLLGQALPES